MRLFTYCIPVDDGAAPNPYFGVCTLAICKPRIRSVARVDDWVVGLGSKNVEGKDYSEKVVYAMKVTEVLTMEKYDEYCQKKLLGKIPDITHQDYERRVGDCIYDFTRIGVDQLRNSVHKERNIKTDLGGHNVLLSKHFYYFGDQAIDLPPELKPIVHQGQGHKSNANKNYVQDFVLWIESLGEPLNSIKGEPQIRLDLSNHKDIKGCAEIRCVAAQEDKEVNISC